MSMYLPTTFPDSTKYVIVLRNPAERAYSHYLQMRKQGREWSADFRQALDLESRRIRENYSPAWHYVNVGRYADQLQRIENKQQIVLLFDDFLENYQKAFDKVLAFLGVSAFHPDTTRKHNTSGLVPRSRLLYELLPNRLQNWNRKKEPALNNRDRAWIIGQLKADILLTQELIGRDLDHWMR
ncbi:sulfotransferase [Pseudomonadota bacterium]